MLSAILSLSMVMMVSTSMLNLPYAQPFQTDKELWQNAKVMEAFVKTMGKRIGPKSGTDKMFVIDGEPDAMAAQYGEYFNYFILQAYNSSGNSDLNSRFTAQATHFQQYLTPEQVANKLIVCENFENYAGKGWCKLPFRQWSDRAFSLRYGLLEPCLQWRNLS